jgi:hypothetical protein
VIHLAIAIPMLVIEVPFGKWAHLGYRPLAIYLVTVIERRKNWLPLNQRPRRVLPLHLLLEAGTLPSGIKAMAYASRFNIEWLDDEL